MSNRPPTRSPSRLGAMLADAAAAYAARGWPILPVHTPSRTGCSCQRPDCPKPGKHPRVRHGLAEASTDAARITRWWSRWPDANIAIATGRLVVLDIDGRTGRAALQELEHVHGALPPTLQATTARGRHLYYHAPSGTQIPCSAGRLAPGVDVRGSGGYVIAPPSRHASGRHYRWRSRHPVAQLPDWLAEHLQPAGHTVPPPPPTGLTRPGRVRRYALAALDDELRAVRSARHGTRNSTLNRAAFRLGQLAATGLLTPDELTDALLAAAEHAGLPAAEARATIASGLRAGHRHPRAPAAHPGRDP